MKIASFSQDSGPTKYLSSLSAFCRDMKMFDSKSAFEEHIASHNDRECIRLIVTGTSLGEGVDKTMLKYSRQHNIQSVSIIDHWSWYRNRFETKNGLLLPDVIIVNDEIAYEDAVLDGLPPDRLIVLGNPVLEERSLRSTNWVKDAATARLRHALPIKKNIILFVSEQLRADFPAYSDTYLGYDEYEVVAVLIANLSPNDHLVIKLHPAEPDNKYSFLNEPQVTMIRNAEVEELAALADVVVGMASMLLLELAMFRDDVISFRPSAKKNFIGERIGATIGASSINMLKEIIKHHRTIESDFRQRFFGSKERIIRFLENMAK